MLGIELSLNSPNARQRDYLYALADHPSRKVGGEKLGRPYGKRALEFEWMKRSPFREEKLREIYEHAILIKDLDELHEMARTLEMLKNFGFASIDGIDRTIARLERLIEKPDGQKGSVDAAEKLERVRQARQFAVEHDMLPAKDPEHIRTHPYSRSSTSWGGGSNSHRSSSHQEHSIERSSRDDYAR